MQVTNVEPLGFRDGSAVSFEVDEVPESPERWSLAVGELAMSELFSGEDLANVQGLIPISERAHAQQRQRDGSKHRDFWAPDHIFHFDGGARWPQPPVLTVIGCREAETGAPGTELLDMVALYDLSIKDGFWQAHGIEPESLAGFTGTFADSTYYREALPYMRDMAKGKDRVLIKAVIKKDLAKSGARDLDEHADRLDANVAEHPIKQFDLVQRTPLRGLLALLLDGGARNNTIQSAEGQDYKPILHDFRRQYLSDDQLQARGTSVVINWRPNRAVIFPRIGVAHRAKPGNSHNRSLNTSFLTEAPSEG